jgi:hypothetical protein
VVDPPDRELHADRAVAMRLGDEPPLEPEVHPQLRAAVEVGGRHAGDRAVGIGRDVDDLGNALPCFRLGERAVLQPERDHLLGVDRGLGHELDPVALLERPRVAFHQILPSGK